MYARNLANLSTLIKKSTWLTQLTCFLLVSKSLLIRFLNECLMVQTCRVGLIIMKWCYAITYKYISKRIYVHILVSAQKAILNDVVLNSKHLPDRVISNL